MALLLDRTAIHRSIDAARAIELTELAFRRHHAGEWVMPAKTYVEAPPDGDFRAMPARGSGYAALKWVTSFPGNPARGLPVVEGALLLSSAETGELLAICDCAAITSLRTGAAAAISARALAREGAERAAVIGCGVNGAWAGRCLREIGYGSGVCADARPEAAEKLAAELGWEAGTRERAVACDVIVTVTPAAAPVIGDGELQPGAHVAALGADAAGKAEVEIAELQRCSLFCDEWKQASAGGELAGAVASGEVELSRVTEIGAVLAGERPGRTADGETTLFDSTGLAIQDLSLAIAAYEDALAGRVEAAEISLAG